MEHIAHRLYSQRELDTAVAEEREAVATLLEAGDKFYADIAAWASVHAYDREVLFRFLAVILRLYARTIRKRSRASGGNGEPIDRIVLELAAVAERQGRPKVAQWLRDYFWNSAQGERLRARTRSGNGGGEEGEESGN